jgi:hypothetical protein
VTITDSSSAGRFGTAVDNVSIASARGFRIKHNAQHSEDASLLGANREAEMTALMTSSSDQVAQQATGM